MDRHVEVKHREVVYQQVHAEVLRESSDIHMLEVTAARVLRSAEVRADPSLEQLIRGIVADRRRDLESESQRIHDADQPQATWSTKLADPHARPPTREQLLGAAARLERQLEEQAHVLDEASAERTLGELRELRRRYPVHVSADALRQAESVAAGLRERVARIRRQVEQLTGSGVAAAQAGDMQAAAHAIRRLRALAELRPAVVSNSRFDELRQRIVEASDEAEQADALRALLARERQVAEEIRKIGVAIREFHRLAGQVAHDDPAYAEAHAQYEEAAKAVGRHDREWLAALILELETIIEDAGAATSRAQAQVDRFLNQVRTALARFRAAVRIIEANE